MKTVPTYNVGNLLLHCTYRPPGHDTVERYGRHKGGGGAARIKSIPRDSFFLQPGTMGRDGEGEGLGVNNRCNAPLVARPIRVSPEPLGRGLR